MFTWVLLPFGFVLTLTFSGPVATGYLDVGRGPCPVIGSVNGHQVGIVAICTRPGGASFFGFPQAAAVEPIALVLDVDPSTLGGTWMDSSADTGTLQPR